MIIKCLEHFCMVTFCFTGQCNCKPFSRCELCTIQKHDFILNMKKYLLTVIEILFRIAYSILRKMSQVDFEIVIVNRITTFYFTVDLQCLKTLPGKCVSLSVLQSKYLAFLNFGSTKAKLKKSCYQQQSTDSNNLLYIVVH